MKTVITQCEIRKLYALKREPGVSEAIDLAKTLERRRCGHHPDQYPEPLDTIECMKTVVDPKSTGQNKHRYVVASQSQEVRRMLRGIRGVPLIYIKRSVMILEPMADESVQVRAREERSKFRAELKNALGKRKREGKGEDGEGGDGENKEGEDGDASEAQKKKKKTAKGVKGVNPLAMKSKKKTSQEVPKKAKDATKEGDEATDAPSKRKRRRRTKSAADGAEAGDGGEDAAPAASTSEES